MPESMPLATGVRAAGIGRGLLHVCPCAECAERSEAEKGFYWREQQRAKQEKREANSAGKLGELSTQLVVQ